MLARSLARSFCSSARSLGVKVESTRAGDGKTFPRPGDTVHMHYTGRLQSTGKVFDSSVERGEPFVTRIGVGQVIRAWDEAVPELSLGQKASVKSLHSIPGVIPANSTLIFEVELLKIEK